MTVNRAATTVALGSSVNPAVTGQAVTFTATVAAVAPGAGTPTGTVTFQDGNVVLGTVAVGAGGTATFTTSFAAAGGHAITAVYNGDGELRGQQAVPHRAGQRAVGRGDRLGRRRRRHLRRRRRLHRRHDLLDRRRDRHQRRHQPGAAGGLPDRALRQLHLHRARPDPGRQLHRAAALRRDLLERRRAAHLQRGDQRRSGAEQLRHLRRRRGQGQGGGRAVHGDGRRAGADHDRLHHRQDNAKSSGIEIIPRRPRAWQSTRAAAPPGRFAADADFTGGATFSTADAINTSGVTNPAPQAVYQTERYGNFTYTVPGLTPGASYTVRLHFAEIYWNAAGQRLFNVAINGAAVLTNFDIFAAAGGKDKAVVEQFTATADAQGRITIAYTTVKNNAKSSGIEIVPA